MLSRKSVLLWDKLGPIKEIYPTNPLDILSKEEKIDSYNEYLNTPETQI